MKRIILVFSLVFSLVSFKASADVVPTNAEKAHQQAVQMAKVLSLSADQQTAVEALQLSTLNSIDAITADPNKDGRAKELEIKQTKADRDTKLSEILTPDQYAAYVAKRDAKKAGADGVH